MIALLLFSAFIFLYKQCYIAIKMGDYEAVSSRISDRWYVAFAESEPFMIQHTLNSVIIEDYSIHAPSHLTGSVLANFDFSGSYKAREYSFGDIATYDLFGDVGYGMASNIWAEYYSCGGLIGVAIFLFFYIISLCSFRLDRYSPFYMCIASGWIPWWVFYIHRNDTFRMVSFAKQYGFILLCGIILAFFLSLLASTPVRPASRGSRLR
ncbi:MAG: hypothetical protein JKY95_03075 [Planctomycetaceae bacterium]|nr:hypothetical protein [Planctomycetaceae bacterium]